MEFIVAECLVIIADDKEKKGSLNMDGEPDWISRMAEEQVIIRQSSGEDADRSSSEGVPEDDSVTISFTAITPEDDSVTISFTRIAPEDDSVTITFTTITPEDDSKTISFITKTLENDSVKPLLHIHG
jgi:hypothetical protein